MSFFKSYPIGILVLSLIITALFGAASVNFGLWDLYGFTPPANTMDTFDKVNDMNQEAENIICDINPESETCTEREGQLSQEELTFIQKMVKGSYGVLVTFIKLFGIPKQFLIDLMTILSIPAIFQVAAYTVLLFTIGISIMIFIFTRSDSQ